MLSPPRKEPSLPTLENKYQLIENHGVIGNMLSAALVSLDGTIDFFCFPAFDSPTIFAALLDSEKGGSFRIEPQIENVRYKQLYLPDTNILLTRYLSDEGVAEVTDFMPVQDGGSESEGAYAHQILRMVRVIKGRIHFRVRCAPRFDYGRAAHRTCREARAICFRPDRGDLDVMALYATVPLEAEGPDAVAEFTLGQGEIASFAFGSIWPEEKVGAEVLDHGAVEHCFQLSSEYWRAWMGHSSYKGRWREIVDRSALVLKLMSSSEYGSNIAAVTFGLPEQPGGTRNWDYRYTWVRDSSFALYAFVRLGLTSEVQAWTGWMRARFEHGFETADTENGPIRIMYRSDGGCDLDEEELPNLAGYKDSRPVRIGNEASKQLQLDIYGEIMDAVYLSNKYSAGIPKEGWRRLIEVMDWLRANWQRPDQGIWELRGKPKHLLHSRLMCWVAFDRVIRLAGKRSLDGPIQEWMETRRAIDTDIYDNFWNEEVQSFVQERGGKDVDAALLLMPMLRYISPIDPRWLSTLKRIEECLTEDSLVFRYRSGNDRLGGEEGSFTACSFWFIECLARAGEVDKARLLFDKMLGYANHLGLYSEELGSSGEHLGNFPQALTHMALISAATYLDRVLDGIKETWS